VLVELFGERRDRRAALGVPAIADFPILVRAPPQLSRPLVSLKNFTFPVTLTGLLRIVVVEFRQSVSGVLGSATERQAASPVGDVGRSEGLSEAAGAVRQGPHAREEMAEKSGTVKPRQIANAAGAAPSC
jgi:hypothetical protein